jgi:hypothetical protein
VPEPFDCGGCPCDGTTHYCAGLAAGPVGPGPTAGPTECVPLPSACNGQPSCACVDPMPLLGCTCTQGQGGVRVDCAEP